MKVLSFWVPQMGPGTPKSRFRWGSSENIQLFHDLAFWGKTQFFDITRPEQKGAFEVPGAFEDLQNVSFFQVFLVLVFLGENH